MKEKYTRRRVGGLRGPEAPARRSGSFPLPTAILILFALLCPVLAAAEDVPRETIERLAEITVETSRIEHLAQIQKITPEDRFRRLTDLRKEEAVLWQPFNRIPHADADSTIQGLSSAKLALLEPQWDRECSATIRIAG